MGMAELPKRKMSEYAITWQIDPEKPPNFECWFTYAEASRRSDQLYKARATLRLEFVEEPKILETTDSK